jgi:hypothetical protein
LIVVFLCFDEYGPLPVPCLSDSLLYERLVFLTSDVLFALFTPAENLCGVDFE